MSPALAGGFLTTVPPGKSLKCLIFSLGNEQGHEVSDVSEGVFPGGELSDLFLNACHRM